MIQSINPSTLYDCTAFGMSQGRVDASGLVFLSGQVAWDTQAKVVGTTYAEQTHKALDNVQLALEAAGSNIDNVLHMRLFVRGEVSEHLPEIAPILAERLGSSPPALTGVGVASLATRDTLVEIEVVARVI